VRPLLCLENFLTVLVDGGNTVDEVAIEHGNMFDPDGEFISGKDHSDEVNIVTIGRK
jgi:hypothetical protein